MFRAGIFSFQAGNTPVADALFPACFSKLLPFGGEYPFRGHGTPRRFFHPRPSRAGNELASRVPLPARDHACFSPPAGSTLAADALLPAYPAFFSLKGRGVPLLRKPCSPPVFHTTACPGGEYASSLRPTPRPRPASFSSVGLDCFPGCFHPDPNNSTCFLPSGLLTSWTPPTPIPRPASFSSVGLDRFPGRFHPESRPASFHFTKKKKSPSR